MVDIVEVSAVVAATGVLVGVIYYILDIRNKTRIRQTDLVIRISDFGTRKEFLEACTDVFSARFVESVALFD